MIYKLFLISIQWNVLSSAIYAPTLLQHLDNGYFVNVIIYLDSQKVFDTVPHQRLLQKLTSFSIHGNFLEWIENFLSSRTQQVVLNGCESHSSPVSSGVPQGPVLGPLLFTMFVNAIVSSLGILQLKFHVHHTTKVTNKVNQVLGMIFKYLDFDMLSKLFTALV